MTTQKTAAPLEEGAAVSACPAKAEGPGRRGYALVPDPIQQALGVEVHATPVAQGGAVGPSPVAGIDFPAALGAVAGGEDLLEVGGPAAVRQVLATCAHGPGPPSRRS